MNQRPEIRNGRQQQSCSMAWAGLQEKIQPKEKCFLLDSFYRTNQDLGRAPYLTTFEIPEESHTHPCPVVLSNSRSNGSASSLCCCSLRAVRSGLLPRTSYTPN